MNKIETLFENAKVWSKLLWKNLVFIFTIGASLTVGFIVGYYYIKINQSYTVKKETKTTTNTSVAINEKNQLIIIDKSNDSYQIYSDSVGMNVFKMYAKTMINQ